MPVPSLITDLTPVAATNSPAGSESPGTADDYFRAHASFIAQLRDSAFGSGQTWQNMVASRLVNVNYTNSTGRPIAVCMSVGSVGAGPLGVSCVVGGLSFGESTISAPAAGYNIAVSFLVPAGATYKVVGGTAIQSWAELRT